MKLDEFCLKHKLYIFPLVAGILGAVVGMGLENRLNALPGEGRQVAALECNEPMEEIPKIDEIVVYAPKQAVRL